MIAQQRGGLDDQLGLIVTLVYPALHQHQDPLLEQTLNLFIQAWKDYHLHGSGKVLQLCEGHAIALFGGDGSR